MPVPTVLMILKPPKAIPQARHAAAQKMDHTGMTETSPPQIPMQNQHDADGFWESLKEWLKARKVMFTHWAYVKNLIRPPWRCGSGQQQL